MAIVTVIFKTDVEKWNGPYQIVQHIIFQSSMRVFYSYGFKCFSDKILLSIEITMFNSYVYVHHEIAKSYRLSDTLM